MIMQAAPSKQLPKLPRDWDKRVSYAYLRLIGHTQVDGAKSVGRSRRTVQSWEENKELWAVACSEAESRWLVELKRASMKSVLNNITAGNAMLGMQVVERMIPELAPPKLRHEHTGKDGRPIELATRISEVPDDALFGGRDSVLSRAVGS